MQDVEYEGEEKPILDFQANLKPILHECYHMVWQNPCGLNDYAVGNCNTLGLPKTTHKRVDPPCNVNLL